MKNNWKKLMAAFYAASMLVILPGLSVYATEAAAPTIGDEAPAEITEEPAEIIDPWEVDVSDSEEQDSSEEKADLPEEHYPQTDDSSAEESVGSGTYVVGGGVTATFDSGTGSIVLKTTTGGTLWVDWLEAAGISRSAVKSIKVESVSGSYPSNRKVKLPIDVRGYTYEFLMFGGLNNLTSLDLQGFDTSAVMNMGYMFYDCSSLTSLDLSGLDTSKVTDMMYMFDGCTNLSTLNLKGIDTSNVNDMAGMFYDCKSLKSIDLSGFKTSKVTNLTYMFSRCYNLTNLNLSGLDTSEVISMYGMFRDCKKLTKLDLRGFKTSNVISVSEMFKGCEKLKYLDIGDFDASKVNVSDEIFEHSDSLEILITPKNKISNCYAALPFIMYDRNGKKYDELPLNTGSMVLGKTKALAASIFIDVRDPSHAYYKAIYWAVEKGITKGYPDGTFGIDRSCTRGEMMMFLWRYAGKPAPKSVSNSPFKDVPKTHTFYNAILWGSQKGITKGYSDGTFGINKSVSRGESMMFLWRLKGKKEPTAVSVSPFKDVPKNHVFYKAILWGYQKKITTGYTSGEKKGTFGINENCTRGQIVTFLYRARNL
ncbi:MAG: BspA family leucine-rich repeat surface protein [Lachnospiraceae bacterium]|nr:BspA family leucine-rich repeat surface protein [Lachnospiraceae bacterium]